jgi:hypothetical protein
MCRYSQDQVENDLLPLKAALEATLGNVAIFIHASGDFAISTADMDVLCHSFRGHGRHYVRVASKTLAS